MHASIQDRPAGFVYFIVIEATPKEKYLKIGFAKDPEARLANLQTANPLSMELLGSIKGDKKLEKSFHQIFGPLRHLNEWFLYTKTVEAVISRMDFYKTPTQKAIEGSCLTFDTIVEHEGTHNTLGDWLAIRAMQKRSPWNSTNRKNQNV